MIQWYYACGGQQNGPVSFEQLVEIASRGELNPGKDLVWNASMKDWLPAGQVPGLFSNVVVPSDPNTTPLAAEILTEIDPGSDRVDAVACLKRGFTLTTRNIGTVILVMITYIGVTAMVNLSLVWMDSTLSLVKNDTIETVAGGSQTATSSQIMARFQQNDSVPHQFISQIIGLFLSIGLTRIGLNLVSGKPVTIGMLFSGAGKLLPVIASSLIYFTAVTIGLLLLVIPGIYIALRYGQFLFAIVDRDMGIIESFRYSSSLTTNNRTSLFTLMLLYVAVSIAGILAFCVGIFFVIPVIFLSSVVAYRWMQYGRMVTIDKPGTTIPMLAD